MLQSGRGLRALVAILSLAIAIAGCEEGGGGGPVVMLDGGSGGGDAGPGGGGDDAGHGGGSDAGGGGGTDAAMDTSCGTDIERQQLAITNMERTSMGLGALRCDPDLTMSARLHAQDMCELRYFSHTSADGRTLRERVEAQDVRWRAIGENIARGQRTAQDVHEAWMGSSGHRANILSDRYGRIGIGYVACPGYGPLWVQNFAD